MQDLQIAQARYLGHELQENQQLSLLGQMIMDITGSMTVGLHPQDMMQIPFENLNRDSRTQIMPPIHDQLCI